MISKQLTLINVTVQQSQFRQLCSILQDHDLDLHITPNNVLHVSLEPCPDCDTIMCRNGSYASSSLYYRSHCTCFKVGQQYCPICDKTHMPKNKVVQLIVKKANQFLEQQMVSLSEKGLSYADISVHLGETLGVKISAEHVSNIVENHISSIELADPLLYPDDWYCYDEQHLKQNGKKVYRVVIYNPCTLQIIYEKDHALFNQEVLREILCRVFKDKKPKGFTFDMAPSYPKVFTQVFGKGIGLQWCLFHLNKLILDEVRKSCMIGRKAYWTLEAVHQLYEALSIFYIRDTTIDYIIECKKRFEMFKTFIADKCTEKSRIKDIRAFEKQVVREIFRYQHQLKLMRKRTKECLRLRAPEDAHKKLNDLVYRRMTLLKPLQNRILYIDENFNRFVEHFRHSGAEHTNNKLESKFGITLRKTEKVRFRSRLALQSCLKLKRIKACGALILEIFSMASLALIGIFGILCGNPR